MPRTKKPPRSENMQTAIDCLKELIANPHTPAERRTKAKQKLKELEKYY